MPIAQSSHLQSYEYDPDTQILTVQFVSGSIYQYFNVPHTEYWNLRQSGGSGSYFHDKIRTSYGYQKIFDPRAE